MNLIDVTASIPKSNYSDWRILPKGIVYHITADNKRKQALSWFQNSAARVSAHYIITPNGDIFLCVNPNMKAYHAGVKKNPTAEIIKDNYVSNPNEFLLGIEVVANGNDITDKQFKALKELTIYLCKEFNIKINRYHLIGHNEINVIDKTLDPISSYSINEIIRGIENDIIIDRLNLENAELIKQNKLDTRIIKKVRKYSSDMKRRLTESILKFRNK